jgi:hypothetical protein
MKLIGIRPGEIDFPTDATISTASNSYPFCPPLPLTTDMILHYKWKVVTFGMFNPVYYVM